MQTMLSQVHIWFGMQLADHKQGHVHRHTGKMYTTDIAYVYKHYTIIYKVHTHTHTAI